MRKEGRIVKLRSSERGIKSMREKEVLIAIYFVFTQIFLHSCTDINECSTNNGGCAHSCVNTQGSFTCSCRSGFQLASDGRGCDGKALLC